MLSNGGTMTLGNTANNTTSTVVHPHQLIPWKTGYNCGGTLGNTDNGKEVVTVLQGGGGKGTQNGGSIIFQSATVGDAGGLNNIDDTILTPASDLSATFGNVSIGNSTVTGGTTLIAL